MALVPLLTFSLVLHALVGWLVVPDLAAVDSALGPALWLVLAISGLLVPMGMLARRVAKPPLADVLTWLGLLCMGLFSSLFVLSLVREAVLLLAWVLQSVWSGIAVNSSALRTDTAVA